MVDIITTLTFELEHRPDTEELRVVVELPEVAGHLRDFLTMQLGARWLDERHFDIEFQYASTAEHHLQSLGVSEMRVRPKDLRLPLAKVVDEATALAKEREDWDVSAIEILDERVTHVVRGQFAGLDLHGTYTVRVTQTR
ncbi:hypothetical protein [Microbacterium maritypicum]|uniref:hypothetical protein n=1 Tax=Microbacterium maritypicum TaxID=33918 RepID=UPI003A94481B